MKNLIFSLFFSMAAGFGALNAAECAPQKGANCAKCCGTDADACKKCCGDKCSDCKGCK